MRKTCTVLAVLMLAGGVCAQQFMIGVRRSPISDDPTDYSQDAACMFALRMNGFDGATDLSANGNNFTEVGILGGSTNVPPGYSGSSRDYDGSANYLSATNNSSLNPTNAITLAAWHMPDAVNNFNKGFIGKYESTGDKRQWMLGHNTVEKPWFFLSSDGTTTNRTILEAPNAFSVDTYFHVAGTYDGATMRLYIDGAEVTNTTHSGGIHVDTAAVEVGRYNADSNGSPLGRIDQVGAWSRAFSPAEIADLYNNGIEGVKGAND